MEKTPTKDQVDSGRLVTAMSRAVLEETMAGKPSPEAMASALVTMQAQFLASIPNDHIRKTFRKSMASLLPQMMAMMIAADQKRAG